MRARVFSILLIWLGQRDEVNLNKQTLTQFKMIDLKQTITELGQGVAQQDTRSKAPLLQMIMSLTRKLELTCSQTGLLEGRMHRVIIIEKNHHCLQTCHPGSPTWQNSYSKKM